MNTSDVLASIALVVSVALGIWQVITHRAQQRLEKSHRELEGKVYAAQLADRQDARVVAARDILSRCSTFDATLFRLNNLRPLTPDTVRSKMGSQLWEPGSPEALRRAATAFDDDSSAYGVTAAVILNRIAAMVTPHLVPKGTIPRAEPFNSIDLSRMIDEAEVALEQLREHVQPFRDRQ